MAIIHISLQAKGGVGKSFLALMLSMFYRHIERPVKIFDTDPANATLFSRTGGGKIRDHEKG